MKRILFMAAIGVLISTAANADNWPQFRGPLPQRCPNYGQQLEVSSASFLLVGRTGDKSIVNDDGRFCPGCDVVILNADYIREVARYGLPTVRKVVVGGFVDLDSVPEDKKSTLLGQKDNPIPLVKFVSFEWCDRTSSSE